MTPFASQLASLADETGSGMGRCGALLAEELYGVRADQVLVDKQPPLLNESMRAIPQRNAFIMDSLLQSVASGGTAAKAQATLKRVLGEGGAVTGLQCVRVEWRGGQMEEVAGSEFVIPADLIQRIPEFKDYTDTFGNIVADRR